jgi:hypothetical protein
MIQQWQTVIRQFLYSAIFAKEPIDHNGFLPSKLPDATRTALPAPSEGSYITLVDDEVYKDVTYKPHKYTWVDRAMEMFCVKVPKKQTIKHQRSVQPRPEVCRKSLLLATATNQNLI